MIVTQDCLHRVQLPPREYSKLPRLRLPSLKGVSFLDVSCGDGFYCGYAQYLGASEVVGFDPSESNLQKARLKYPNIKFLQKDWDSPLDQKFDVILMTCADRFFKSQWELIEHWLGALNPDGVLILEVATHPEFDHPWQEIVTPDCGKQEVLTDRGAATLFRPYAYRVYDTMEHKSVVNALPTTVIHVKNKRPFACLLMMPSSYGKSSVARTMFDPDKVKMVSGDYTFSLATQDDSMVPEEIKHLFKNQSRTLNVHALVHRAIEEKLHMHLVDMVLRRVPLVNCVLDMYFPEEVHEEIRQYVESKGFIPLLMNWEMVGRTPMPAKIQKQEAQGYAFYNEPDSAKRILY